MFGILTPEDSAGITEFPSLLPGFVSLCWPGLFELHIFIQLEDTV